MSEPLLKYSCILPSRPQIPKRVSGSRTDLTLEWQIPASDGGCPLTGFNLYKDDGAEGSITTEVSPAEIENRPSLLRHTQQFS